MVKKHFRVCLDRTGNELETMYGFSLGLVSLDTQFAEQKVVRSDIKYAFRHSKFYSVSRYSDGTWPVLYTAKDAHTAICEVGFHARKLWKKDIQGNAKRKSRMSKRLIYTLLPPSATVEIVADVPEVTESDDYSHCHKLAREARSRKIGALDAPSARNKGGRCIPLFDRALVHVELGLQDRFTIRWRIADDYLWHTADGKATEICLWKA